VLIRILQTDALAAATSTLSLDAQKRAEKDAHKKALKAEAAEAKQAATIASSKVIIKRVERNKVRLTQSLSILPHPLQLRLVEILTNRALEEIRNRRLRPRSLRSLPQNRLQRSREEIRNW